MERVFDMFIEQAAPIYFKLYDIYKNDIQTCLDMINTCFNNYGNSILAGLAKKLFLDNQTDLDRQLYNYYNTGRDFELYNSVSNKIMVKGHNEPFPTITCEEFITRFF